MNAEQLAEFHERIGYSVIVSASSYWYGNHLVHINLPLFQNINPPLAELEALLLKHRLAVIRYSSLEQQGKIGYFFVCEDKSYSLANLSKSSRKHVRRGFKSCYVRQIDFDYLHEHGLPLNIDSTRRHQRDNPLYTYPERWAQFCDAGRRMETEGARVWGAFADGQLAAYVVGLIVDDWADLLVMMSRTDMLPYRPNHVLIYSVTKQLLSESGINHVGMGQSPLVDKPGVDTFKKRMGFVPRETNFVAVIHPWLRPFLLSGLGRRALLEAKRLVPQYEVLNRIAAILEVAQLSRE